MKCRRLCRCPRFDNRSGRAAVVSAETRPRTALGREQAPRRRGGKRRSVARTSRGRLRSPDRCRAVLARWPGAKHQARAPVRRAACAVFCLPVGPVFCLPRRPKAPETASYRKAAAFEHIIRRLYRKQKRAFCRSFRADARTRTEDPFITSFEPLSPPVTRSHLRSLATPVRRDWR
jgi:hypothetical protein